MNMSKITLPEPPNVLKSIRNGFDAITKHLVLLLFPIGLDLFLWFGPHLQIKSLIKGLILSMNEVPGLMPADFGEVVKAGQEIWTAAAERINLLIGLRSLPVGIFSLFTGILPIENPLGSPIFWDISSLGTALLIVLIAFTLGIFMGGLFFSAVRQVALYDDLNWRNIFQDWPRVSMQSGILSLIWIIFFMAILVVGSCAATGITLFSVSLGQMVIILFGIISFWLIFPLIFSPHGIYSKGQKAWKSILSSIRLTNLTFLKTSMFVLLVLLLNQGLNMLWQVPPENSWLMLISVIGHAFVTTGMLSASFVYYQDMNRWSDEIQSLGLPKPIAEERSTIEK